MSEGVYLVLPSYFYSDTGEYRDNVVIKLNKSLFGMVQAPLYWYNHLMGDFEARGFKLSLLDPCMFCGIGIIALICVGDVLFFGLDQDKIDEVLN